MTKNDGPYRPAVAGRGTTRAAVMTEVALAGASAVTSGGNGLHHVHCCDENLALCGADLTDSVYSEEPLPGEVPCTVCYSFEDLDIPCRDWCDA